MVDDEQPRAGEVPEFGPGGYLPERASRRARKIVLRAPMGLQWVVGALVVGVGVLVAGLLAFGGDDAPQPPYVLVVEDLSATAPTSVVDARGNDALGIDVLVVTAGGRPRAFRAPGVAVEWCPASGFLEAADGRAWRPTGRGLNGASLVELAVAVHDGALWVDPTAPQPVARPDELSPPLGCVEQG